MFSSRFAVRKTRGNVLSLRKSQGGKAVETHCLASYSLSLKTSAELHRILEILIAQGSTSILFKNKETNEVHVALFLIYRIRWLFHMNDTDNVQ